MEANDWKIYDSAYNMIPHSRILKSFELVQVFEIIDQYLSENQRRTGTLRWHYVETIWQRLISDVTYFRVTVWNLWFAWCSLLTQTLRKVESVYKLKNGERFNHLLLKDDLKIFARSEKEVNELFSSVQKYSVMILGLNFGWRIVVSLYLKDEK